MRVKSQAVLIASAVGSAKAEAGPFLDPNCLSSLPVNSEVCIAGKQICDQDVRNTQYEHGGNYCDEGIREVNIKDNDCTTNIDKFTNNAKQSFISRDNSVIGPNVVKKVNDVT